MLHVKFSPTSQGDLFDIRVFGIDRFGVPKAESYVDEMIDRAYWLAENQSLWNRRSDIAEGLFGYFQGSHLIIFERHEEVLFVLRILHQSMDPARHLRSD